MRELVSAISNIDHRSVCPCIYLFVEGEGGERDRRRLGFATDSSFYNPQVASLKPQNSLQIYQNKSDGNSK